MKKNKGFTLVEVIVILVILAILAAVLIPSLTTYIDKAKEKSIAANARAAYVATQALASEAYGKNTASTFTYTVGDHILEIEKLAQLVAESATATDTDITITGTVDAKGNVTEFTFKDKGLSNKTAYWDNSTGAWTVS